MRILLTNDDGVHSPGILLLADRLRKAGHRVFVFAPAADQSGVSHSISFFRGPCKIVNITEDTWSCNGTPADCVVTALMGGISDFVNGKQFTPPDTVISGINRGANLGTDIVYSGTAAAARQGALCGIPSLALSLVEPAGGGTPKTWNWDMAIDFITANLDTMFAYWKPNSFINVNIPSRREQPAALVHAFPSLRYYNDYMVRNRMDVYDAPDGHRYCFTGAGDVSVRPDQGSDWAAVEEHNASLSEIFIHPLLLESVKGEV